MRKTKRVKLTLPWTDEGGTKHKQNDVVELDRDAASALVRGGRANEVTVPTKRAKKEGE